MIRSKPNYKLKSEVLKTDLPLRIKKLDYLCRENITYEICEELDSLLLQYGGNFIDEARRLNQSFNKRACRLKERIRSYLEMGQCIWLTLTFSEDVLSSTSVDTRRKYVQRYLKSQSDYYLANIDFGKTTEREHYHAVVLSEHLDKSAWIYGFTWTERIKNHLTSDTKLAKYVSKLTNHAIKETTKRQCYIYSRCK